jgi:putative photosynthetic complex assembly protein 2
MLACGLAILYALFIWWFSTGAILYLDGLPRQTFPVTILGMSVLAAAGLVALHGARHDVSAVGAYHAFTGALAVWALNEITFLMGLITGPRRNALLPETSGFARLIGACKMILWHEAAVLIGFAAVIAATWQGSNALGIETYALLWMMRLSAKINIYLGVPHAPLAFLPEQLRYIGSAFRNSAMNSFFPLCVTLATVALALMVERAMTATDEGVAIRFTLLSVLMGLAILEHWFLVLPLPSERLWKWGFKSHDQNIGLQQHKSFPDLRINGSL